MGSLASVKEFKSRVLELKTRLGTSKAVARYVGVASYQTIDRWLRLTDDKDVRDLPVGNYLAVMKVLPDVQHAPFVSTDPELADVLHTARLVWQSGDIETIRVVGRVLHAALSRPPRSRDANAQTRQAG